VITVNANTFNRNAVYGRSTNKALASASASSLSR
jgi:hypothetical protein